MLCASGDAVGDTEVQNAHRFGDKRTLGDIGALIAKPMRVKHVWGDTGLRDAHRIGDSHV